MYRYRGSLISKEQMEPINRDKIDRQVNHLTPTGGSTMFLNQSVNDDLESFIKAIQLGENPESLAWTNAQSESYFLPKLTKEELKLIEKKQDEKFLQTFWHDYADVDRIDMMSSSSDGGNFVSAYCRRKTLLIESEQRRGRRKFVWKGKDEESQYRSTEDTIELIESRMPFYPLLGNA